MYMMTYSVLLSLIDLRIFGNKKGSFNGFDYLDTKS